MAQKSATNHLPLCCRKNAVDVKHLRGKCVAKISQWWPLLHLVLRWSLTFHSSFVRLLHHTPTLCDINLWTGKRKVLMSTMRLLHQPHFHQSNSSVLHSTTLYCYYCCYSCCSCWWYILNPQNTTDGDHFKPCSYKANSTQTIEWKQATPSVLDVYTLHKLVMVSVRMFFAVNSCWVILSSEGHVLFMVFRVC